MPEQNLVICVIVYIIWCKHRGRAVHNHRCIRIITLANRGEPIIFFLSFRFILLIRRLSDSVFCFVCCIFYSHRLFLFDVIHIGGVTTLTLFSTFLRLRGPVVQLRKERERRRETWPENQHPIRFRALHKSLSDCCILHKVGSYLS